MAQVNQKMCAADQPGRGYSADTAKRCVLLGALFLGCLLLATGCPSFEDGYSGTYREVDFAPNQDEVIAVDFFRFGTDARAIVRYYRRTASSAIDSPFLAQNQTRCAWTKADQFDEDALRFSLPIPPSARRPQANVIGAFDKDAVMIARVVEDGQQEVPRELKLALVSTRPNANCVAIEDFFVRAVFDEQESNTLAIARYELRYPVLAIMWVGVEPVQRDGAVLFVAFNRPEPTVRLDAGRNFSSEINGLQGSLALLIPQPSDRILVRSGNTRYALAHFVVIDDREAEGRFSWDINEEPIVATALQRGRREDVPEDIESNGWGKAVLFVEGKLSELDDNLQLRLDGLEQSDDNAHFYIVDVFFYNDEVALVRLPQRPQPNKTVQRRVPIQLTETYLDRREVLLPRLFPYNY